MRPNHWTPERIQALADRLGSLEALAVALDVSFYTVNRWVKGRFAPDKRNAKALDELVARQGPGR